MLLFHSHYATKRVFWRMNIDLYIFLKLLSYPKSHGGREWGEKQGDKTIRGEEERFYNVFNSEQ